MNAPRKHKPAAELSINQHKQTKGRNSMQFFDTYKQENPSFSQDTFDCAKATVDRLLDTDTPTDNPGMLLGKVQSGKTRTFISITADAFDRGFGAVVVLTKNSKALAEQTIKRLKSEFNTFIEDGELEIYDIMSAPEDFNAFELESKLIFVAKKQTHNLDRLIERFDTSKNLSDVRTLIIDDEADSASIGYARREGQIESTTIASKISELRDQIAMSSLEGDIVAANGVFHPRRPAFTQLVPVPPEYVGGDTYFGEAALGGATTVESCIHTDVDDLEFDRLKRVDRRSFKIEECLVSDGIKGYRRAFVTFIVGGCIQILNELAAGKKAKKLRYSFLLHSEAAKLSHDLQLSITKELNDQLTEAGKDDEVVFHELVDAAYNDLSQSLTLNGDRLPPLDEVKDKVKEALAGEYLTITKVNSDEQVASMLDNSGQLKLRSPLNIFIGGQVLDRGVTLENLIGFYYGRRPQRFQQDTVLQHSRMYGYRRKDIAVTRFYTSVGIRQAMANMEEFDTSLRDVIEAGGDRGVQFIRQASDGTIVPCSPNKIMIAGTQTLRPKRRIIPVGFQTDYKTRIGSVIEAIDQKVEPLIEFNADQPVEIPLETAKELLDMIEPTLIMEEDVLPFDWEAAKASLYHLSQQHPDENERGKVLLWTANNRDSGRLASENSNTKYIATPDSAKTEGRIMQEFATDIPILFLLRQNGTADQGWRDTPFYWPVIRAQLSTPTSVYTSESQV